MPCVLVLCSCAVQDTLMDLLLPKSRGQQPSDLPKLDIKKDQKGMVTVVGATVVEVTSGK